MTEDVACSEFDLVDQALTHVLALHCATQARGGSRVVLGIAGFHLSDG